ncbi:MAG TPA: methyltransferase domain-containing protein [Anaerolineales bacterium]|nr:methyltransferase domain-containing protein [Anaerolineales bacterium]
MNEHEKYIPALRYDWLTPLYDSVMRWGMHEDQFKSDLIRLAQIKPGMRVLDLGCGTATLTIKIKQAFPGAEVVGLDGDARVLEIGRAKAQKAGVNIILDQGMSFDLPYPDHSFDRVLSSLVFHHLTTHNKQRTMAEVLRILRPGGELHIADFGKPNTTWARLISLFMARLEEASDNFKGRLPVLLQAAGFDQVGEQGQYATIFGTLALYQARKPA